jgi:hypothetical protein
MFKNIWFSVFCANKLLLSWVRPLETAGSALETNSWHQSPLPNQKAIPTHPVASGRPATQALYSQAQQGLKTERKKIKKTERERERQLLQVKTCFGECDVQTWHCHALQQHPMRLRPGTHYPHVTWAHVMLRVQLGYLTLTKAIAAAPFTVKNDTKHEILWNKNVSFFKLCFFLTVHLR